MLVTEVMHDKPQTLGLMLCVLYIHSKAISLLFLDYKYLLKLFFIPSCHRQNSCA